MERDDVKLAQWMLNVHAKTHAPNGNTSLPLLSVDGEYGSKTVERVQEFQYNHELPATGRLDAATQRKLRE